jgi:tetratricopeptide (TPR) repeat protein
MRKNLKISLLISASLFFATGCPCCKVYGVPVKNTNTLNQARILTSAINKNPDDTEASLKLIKFYLDTDQDAKAQIEINRMKSRAGNDSKYFVYAAKLLYKNGMNDDAEDMAKKAVKLSYNNADAFTLLGDIYFNKLYQLGTDSQSQEIKRNYLTKAFDYYFTAYKYNPSSPFACIGMAQVYYMTGENNLSNDQIQKAKELGYNNAEAYYLIGEFYYKLKDYAKSKAYLEKSVGTGLSSKYKTYYLLGTIYEDEGNIETAQNNYLKSLKLKPDHLDSQQSLDRLIKTSYKEIKSTKDILKKTTDLFSDLNEDLNALMQADYYLVLDEFTRAREAYLKVLDNSPSNANALSGLAELYYAKWAEGFTNSADFLDDSKYILKAKETQRIVIPLTKFQLINAESMPQNIREKLISLSVSETFDFYELLNEVRAEFLLGNFEQSHEKLQKLLSLKLSNYEKFKVLKSLCYDHNYDEALILIQELKKTYYHNDELQPIVNRISAKYTVLEEKLAEAEDLFNKKDKKENNFAGAEAVIKQAARYFPTSKKAFLLYADWNEKQGNYKAAIEKAHVCLRLSKLYPEKQAEFSEESIKKYIQKLNQALAKTNSSK